MRISLGTCHHSETMDNTYVVRVYIAGEMVAEVYGASDVQAVARAKRVAGVLRDAAEVWKLTRPCGVSFWYDGADVMRIVGGMRPGEQCAVERVTYADVPEHTVVARLGAPDERKLPLDSALAVQA